MDVPEDHSTSTSAPPLHPTLREAVRSPRRRRPTGAAPPLPYRLQTSGIRWLVAAVVLVGLTVAIFARGLRGPAVAVTVVDDAVVRWLASLVGPGLVAPLRGLARVASWWVLWTLSYGLLLVLLVLRRWRHLIIWWVVVQLGSFLTIVLGMIARRPRPFGVELQTSWGGWAMPSVQVAYLTAGLMTVLYTLVPEGRWRNLGKWVVAGLITLVALARMALGVDAPTDLLVGVGLGVALPLLLFRRFAPNEVYPVAYRRGRSAHLDIGGARGQAIRRALEDQLGLVVEEVKPFGLAGSAGSTPLRIKVNGDPPRQLFGKLYAQSHLRSDRWYKLGRELLYGRLEDEKPFHTVRRLVQQEDYALHKLHLAGLPSPAPFGFVELTPEREYLLVAEFFDGATELGEAEVDERCDRRRPRDHPQAVGRRAGPPRHQAGQPAGPRRPDAADRRGLRRGPPQPLAPGRGPGQHDAVFGPALQPRAGLPAGPAVLHRGGDHRGVRGRPRPGPPLPAAPPAPGPGPEPARRVHPPAAQPTPADPGPALERPPGRAVGSHPGPAGLGRPEPQAVLRQRGWLSRLRWGSRTSAAATWSRCG